MLKNVALMKGVYDINLNYLGVRSQESGVRRKERRIKRNRRRKFFVCSLIRTRHHTSNYQCQQV
ncbi:MULTISPECIES: hypothetical protein [unclassified Okeania]|uniref:hypothetical protein n=1 Tax=unclassified Okeania TaxID=2634635 RepID=UPI0013B66068|nr:MULTISPECIES: hypothetical protein [unclassified Okeania]NET23051.1 hypothetical protein [Okeania sp. SIO1H5]NET97316.1 hypothetical protein [Okeania sp. SIO1H2]